MVQMDGSYHDWLEGRGPWLTLLLSVDDATGTIPWALFRQHEDAQGYFKLLWGIVQGHGIPLAAYTDRHAVFQPPRRPSQTEEESLDRKRGRTQVGRALRELGICQVFARSPEAKGRIERMNGTFQDRLVSELRLAGATSMAEANRVLWGFLPRFNQHFGVPPAKPEAAYRQMEPGLDLAAVLCFKHDCKVARDNTVKYRWHTLQLLPDPERRSYSGIRVEIQERLDGSMVIFHQGRMIPSREAPPRADVLRMSNSNWNGPYAIPEWLTENGNMDSGSHVKRTAIVLNPPPRGPTQRKVNDWEAVRVAKRRGLSVRAIARELGLSRTTVTKYLASPGPTVYSTMLSVHTAPSPALLTESLNN